MRPHKTVTIAEGSPLGAGGADAGTAFVIGLGHRGPIGSALVSRSLAQWRAAYGDRTDYSVLYDAVETFFREGGSRIVTSRIVGPDAAEASVTINSDTDPTLTVTAVEPGQWGNDIEVEIIDGAGDGYVIEVSYDGTVVERSPELDDNAAAEVWAAQRSSYVTITDLEEGNPDLGAESLSGGTDDRQNITTAEVEEALAAFDRDYGPGQVLYPGATDASMQGLVNAHARDYDRVALLDGDDVASASALVTDAEALRGADVGRDAALFAPWAVVPGLTLGTTRTVPYSIVQAALMSRLTARGENPNIAAAGENGVCRWVIGLTQPGWSADDRDALAEAGVNVARVIAGDVRTYGYRTLASEADDPNWISLGASRLAKVIAWQANDAAEKFMFRQIDGRGRRLSKLAHELQTILSAHYAADALYGETPDDAFEVNVGEAVNPPADLANGRIAAQLRFRVSAFAEWIEITIVKVPNEEAL